MLSQRKGKSSAHVTEPASDFFQNLSTTTIEYWVWKLDRKQTRFLIKPNHDKQFKCRRDGHERSRGDSWWWCFEERQQRPWNGAFEYKGSRWRTWSNDCVVTPAKTLNQFTECTRWRWPWACSLVRKNAIFLKYHRIFSWTRKHLAISLLVSTGKLSH